MRRLRARLPLGPVVLDPLGPALTDDDRRRMGHPACGGVILFARNFENAAQLQALTEEMPRSSYREYLETVLDEG